MQEPLWYTVLAWLFTILGFVGNSFVILLISSKKKLIRRKTNWFLLSLCFADLGVSLSMYPAMTLCHPSKHCRFVLLASFQWAFLYSSVINLCLLTVDRYIAIVKPFMYVLLMSTFRAVAFICAAWLIPFTLSFLPFTFLYSQQGITAMKGYSYLMIVGFEFIPTLTLLSVTSHLIFIARKHARETASVMAQLRYNQPMTESNNVATLRHDNRRRSSVIFIVSIVVFFIFCYSATIARTCCDIFTLCSYTPSFYRASQLLQIANSAFNPLAYGFLKLDIKAEVKKLLRIATDDDRSSMQLEQR